MDYKILVIDDEQYMHMLISNLLGNEFEIINADKAQQAIDILSEQSVHLILTDIHMPGLNGLELLESLNRDINKKDIPVLVMTNLPSYEKEQKAANLGAADFIDKMKFNTNKEEVLERIRMKIVSNVLAADFDEDLLNKKNKLVTNFLGNAIKSSFQKTVDSLSNEIVNLFEADCVGIWGVDKGIFRPFSSSVKNKNTYLPEKDIVYQDGYNRILHQREAYLNNSVLGAGNSFFRAFSEEQNLPAEIGIPLFGIDERSMLLNKFEIPDEAEIFGIAVIKRNRLFSSGEYEVISQLVTQFGAILWRLHSTEALVQ